MYINHITKGQIQMSSVAVSVISSHFFYHLTFRSNAHQEKFQGYTTVAVFTTASAVSFA